MSIVFDLWEHVGTGLIVLNSRGATYTNQVGGHACEHPTEVGFFVPFGNDATLDGELISAEAGLAKLFDPAWGRIDVGRADELDAFFQRYARDHWLPWAGVRVDRDRLQESREAWIYVVLEGHPERFPFRGVEFPAYAVLTWCNSD